MIGRERPPGRLPAPVVRPLVRLIGRLVATERLPVERQRARMESLSGGMPPPSGVTTAPTTVGGVDALRIAPEGATPTTALLYLHGGGYCIGSSTTAKGFAAHLALALDVEVVAADYRLAPEHPYPAALDDATAAFTALADQHGAEHVAVAGDSAGAGLAVALAMRLRDGGRPLPAALGLVSPWLDLAADRGRDPALVRRDPMLDPDWLAACAARYAGGRPRTEPGISPLHGDLSGLPPTLVVAGADDVLVSDADRFVPAARDAGVEVAYIRVPGLWHIYPTQAGVLAEADRAVEHLAAFVGGALADAALPARREAPGA